MGEPSFKATGRGQLPTRLKPRVSPWEDEAPSEERQEGWILTYIDLLTLLLTFFVLVVSQASFFDDTRQTLGKPQATAVVESPVTGSGSGEHPAAARLQQAIRAQALDDKVGVTLEKGRVNLEIKDNILFVQGSADLTEEGFALLDRIVPILQDNGFPVSVEGHTDDVPISTPRFPSNWELSAARATTVVRHLIRQGVDPVRLKAIGRADTQPVADNSSAQGRSRNRRVILVIHMENPAPEPGGGSQPVALPLR